MYTWTIGSNNTAAYNLGLVIPKIRWLGATNKDLRVTHRPDDIDRSLDALLQKPWIRAAGDKVQQALRGMVQGIGGIEDMGGEFELGALIFKKISEDDYIHATRIPAQKGTVDEA